MKNEDLQKSVQDAIKWEPLLNAAEIGVTVNDGLVTLRGTVNSYAKKLEAENAAKNVAGVKGLVEKIEVKLDGVGKKSDNEIATDALNALKQNWELADADVKVKVEDGWITLDGSLPWNFQKESAKRSVNHIAGVKGVINNIKIEAATLDEIEEEDIEDALERNWSINADDIEVKVSGKEVTLSGTVYSLYEKNEAERVAWNAPGVWNVNNELVVDFDYEMAE